MTSMLLKLLTVVGRVVIICMGMACSASGSDPYLFELVATSEHYRDIDLLLGSSINNQGDVIFAADIADRSASGIFFGPDPLADVVLGTATTGTVDTEFYAFSSFESANINDNGTSSLWLMTN